MFPQGMVLNLLVDLFSNVSLQVRRNARWTEKLFGEGPVSWFSHVIVPKMWAERMPEALWAEKEMLQW
jgi:hypothetical protein